MDLFRLIKYYPRYFFKAKQEAYKMAVSHFPGFSESEIHSKVESINSIIDASIDLNFISKDLFILSSEKIKTEPDFKS